MSASGILCLLEGLGPIKEQPTKHHQSYKACCPAHDDKDPSLVVTELHDGRVLLKCWAGCGSADILAALGQTTITGSLDWSLLYPTTENIQSVFGPKPSKKTTQDHYLLEIAKADRKAGKRLTDHEKKLEFQAYLRVKK